MRSMRVCALSPNPGADHATVVSAPMVSDSPPFGDKSVSDGVRDDPATDEERTLNCALLQSASVPFTAHT